MERSGARAARVGGTTPSTSTTSASTGGGGEARDTVQWEGSQTLMERTAQMVAEGRMSERDGDLAVLAEASRLYAEHLAAIRRRRGQARAA